MNILIKTGFVAVTLILCGCSNDLIKSNSDRSNHAVKSEDIKLTVNKFTLDNGLRVIVNSNHKSPIVHVGAWFHVGSKDEAKGQHGFAHLFEHIMTTGSEHNDKGLFDSYKGIGVTHLNATTWFDRTNYLQTVPTNALEKALWLESERLSYMLEAITQKKLDQQRNIVKNEITGRINGPLGDFESRLLKRLFPSDHPYHHHHNGTIPELDAVTVEQAKIWFNQYYGASNVVLVLSGDVTLERAKKLVKQYFSSAPSGPKLAKLTDWTPITRSIRVEEIQTKSNKTNLVRIWAVPSWRNQELTQLQLVANSMFRGVDAFLNQKLVNTGLVNRLVVQVMPFELSSQFKISLELKNDSDVEKVSKALDKALLDYYELGIKPELLQKLITRELMLRFAGLENVTEIGKQLAQGELYAGHPLYFKQQLHWLETTRVEDLKTVADKWLSNGYYQAILTPTPKYRSIPEKKPRVEPTLKKMVNLSIPKIETFSLTNGVKVNLIQRKNSQINRMVILLNVDQQKTQGNKQELEILAELSTNSTKNYSENELRDLKDKQGLRVNAAAEKNWLSLTISAMKVDLDTMISVAADIILHPQFSNENLLKVTKKIEAVNSRPNRTAGNSSQLTKQLWKSHSAITKNDTKTIVNEIITIENIKALHKQLLHSENISIIILGDIDRENLSILLEKKFSSLKIQPSVELNLEKTASEVSPDYNVPIKRSRPKIILIDKPRAKQTGLMGGIMGIPETDPNFQAFSIATEIFGGMGTGRLHKNLREDKAWTYVASAGHRKIDGEFVWTFASYVQADKTIPAIKEIIREITQFVSNKPASKTEVDNTISAKMGKLPAKFESSYMVLKSIVDSFKNHKALDYEFTKLNSLTKITVNEVVQVTKRVIKPEQIVWVIEGDLSKIEAGIRKLNLGDIEVVTNK